MWALLKNNNHLFTLSLILVLMISGLALRHNRDSLITTGYVEGATEQKLARFLYQYGLKDIRLVHYTRDGGIRGLQISLPQCQGNLQIAVMPEGDELHALWEAKVKQAGYRKAYLFNQKIYPDFPGLYFWFTTLAHAVAHRLHIHAEDNVHIVVALAVPKDCTVIERIPWAEFEP